MDDFQMEAQEALNAMREHEEFKMRELKRDMQDERMKDAVRAVETHEEIMRAMGQDEKYETMLWDARHDL